MTTDGPTTSAEAPRTAKAAARTFAVRLWKEEMTGGSEYRGSVRDVSTDGFRGFRDWSDLIAFMVARVEQDESVTPRREKTEEER